MTTAPEVPGALASWWPSLGAFAVFAFGVYATRRQRRHLEEGRGGWPQRHLDNGSRALRYALGFFAFGMLAGRIAVLYPSIFTRVLALTLFAAFVVAVGCMLWRVLQDPRDPPAPNH